MLIRKYLRFCLYIFNLELVHELFCEMGNAAW